MLGTILALLMLPAAAPGSAAGGVPDIDREYSEFRQNADYFKKRRDALTWTREAYNRAKELAESASGADKAAAEAKAAAAKELYDQTRSAYQRSAEDYNKAVDEYLQKEEEYKEEHGHYRRPTTVANLKAAQQSEQRAREEITRIDQEIRSVDVPAVLMAQAEAIEQLPEALGSYRKARRDVPALRGWRREVFGADALRLCDGEIALAAKGARVVLIEA